MNLKEFRESTDSILYWKLSSATIQDLLFEAIKIIEGYENNRGLPERKCAQLFSITSTNSKSMEKKWKR